MIPINVEFDVKKGLRETQFGTLFVSGDADAHQLRITLLDNGAAYSASSGTSVVAKFVQANGEYFAINGSLSGNIATVTLTSRCYSVNGMFVLNVKLNKGSESMSILYGKGSIQRSSGETLVQSPVVTDVDALLAEIANMRSETSQTVAATGAARQAVTDMANVTGYQVIEDDGRGYITTNADSVDLTTFTDTTNARHSVVACKPGDEFIINGKGGANGRLYAILKSDDTVLARAPSRYEISDLRLTIPDGGAKLVINHYQDEDSVCYRLLDKGLRNEISNTRSAISYSVGSGTGYDPIPDTGRGFITLFDPDNDITVADLTVISSPDQARHSIIDCQPGDQFVINAAGGVRGRTYGILQDDNTIIERGERDVRLTDYLLTIPDGGAKLVINHFNDENSVCFRVTNVGLNRRVNELENKVANDIGNLENKVADDLVIFGMYGLHTRPKSQGVFNMIKNCRQLTDIRWTPIADLPRACLVDGDSYGDNTFYFEDVFHAGVEYQGIPYSQNKYVGLSTSIEQFISLIETNGSRMYTDSEYSDRNHSTYIGTVCSGLQSYAMNMLLVPSNQTQNIPSITALYPIMSGGVYHDIDDLELGDLLSRDSHVAIVTDIIHDAAGHVTHVEVSEATKYGKRINEKTGGQYGGLCRRVMWAKNDFLRWFSGFTVLRYGMIDDITYTPDPRIPMPDEGNTRISCAYAVAPADGNGAAYVLSSKLVTEIKLIINNGAETDKYEFLQITHNGVDFESPVSIAGKTSHSVDFTGKKDKSYLGDWGAYLFKGGKRSAACKWRMAGTTAVDQDHFAQLNYFTDGTDEITVTIVTASPEDFPLTVDFNVQDGSDWMPADRTRLERTMLSAGNWQMRFQVKKKAGVSVRTVYCHMSGSILGTWVTPGIAKRS